MATVVLLERALGQGRDAPNESGVEHRVLKGSALAHLDYDDPALRSFGDNDVLVRSTQFDAAVAALTDRRAPRKFPEARPGFDRRSARAAAW